MPKKSEKIEYPLESLPDSLPDEIDPEQYIIGTYYVGLPVGIPVKDVAQAATLEQRVGSLPCRLQL